MDEENEKQKKDADGNLIDAKTKKKIDPDGNLLSDPVKAPAQVANSATNAVSNAAGTTEKLVKTGANIASEVASIPGRVIGSMGGGVARGGMEQVGQGARPTLETFGKTAGSVMSNIPNGTPGAPNANAAPAAPTSNAGANPSSPFSINPFSNKPKPK